MAGCPSTTNDKAFALRLTLLPAATRCNLLFYVNVYINDFVCLAQGDAAARALEHRHLFHTTDATFCPNDNIDGPVRQEPNSLKKLRRGNAAWSMQKKVLGWLLETANLTVSLPANRIARVCAALDAFPLRKKRTSARKWHHLLGILQNIVPAILRGIRSVSFLQAALPLCGIGRMALNPKVHEELDDWHCLLAVLAARLMHLHELVHREAG